jgi:DNA-binding beta-propeller fold protein YncE
MLATNSRVYVVDRANHRVQQFTSSGSFVGLWGSYGTADGQFIYPGYVGATNGGVIFIADTGNERVQYFSASGSFLGKWGSPGSGNGQFDRPLGVVPLADGSRVYVADSYNHRIQYFRETFPNVAPSSVGRIKALFK